MRIKDMKKGSGESGEKEEKRVRSGVREGTQGEWKTRRRWKKKRKKI